MASLLDDSASVIGRKRNKLIANIRQWPALYVMLAIGVAWFVVFKYVPMAGVIIAFQKFKLFKGLWGSDWVGLTNFIRFANDPYAFRVA